MSEQTPSVGYRVAVIGAGPAGLSAVARAAYLDGKAGRATPTHVLLEGSPAHAKTIQRYQKGKLVMAEPGFLDLRCDLRFAAGSREQVLSTWQEDYLRVRVNIRLGATVKGVSGQSGNFRIQLADGGVIPAETIVLAIGLEGNPRKVGAPGDDSSAVQYQLDDPKAYNNETIVVVGADEALERFKAKVPMFRELNALAFRELIIESEISVAYRDGPEYADETRKVEALIAKQASQGR